MNITCAIIDDEPLALELLENYVSRVPFLKLTGKYTSAIEALARIKEDGTQLLFLDIQMPDLNGLEFSRIIDSSTKVVFTTAFSEYAIESYRSQALDYLLKPINFTDFMNAANKALKWFEVNDRAVEAVDNENKFIIVKSEYKLIQIDIDKILYIEGLKDYVKIYIEDSPQPVLSLMSLKALETSLPSSRFIRVHRSFIVHTSKIRLIERNRIVFGKQYIPVSETYKDTFMDYINKHSINPTKDDNNNI